MTRSETAGPGTGTGLPLSGKDVIVGKSGVLGARGIGIGLGWVAALAACLAGAPASAQLSSEYVLPGSSPEIAIDEQAMRAAGISFAPIERERGATELVFPGTVVVPPAQLRVVAAPVDGLIEAVEVAPDELVTAGQTIIWIRSPELVQAQREFISADADATLARDRLRRTAQLFAANTVAERELRVVENEAKTTSYRFDERLHVLSLMGMTKEDIDTLQRTRDFRPSIAIVAPKAGVVLTRLTSPGARVTAADPLFTIAQLEPLWVNIQVPASRLDSIAVGSRVALAAQSATGEIIRIGRNVDGATQSATAIAQIDTNRGNVRPGLAVTVSVRVEQNGDTQWVVPAASVVRHSDRSWIFVRVSGGARAVPVQVLAENARDVSIRADLAPSAQIATRGLIALLAELARKDTD